jgi:hypothetical protein
VLRECIEAAEPYPIAGLHGVLDFAEDTLGYIGTDAPAGTQPGGRRSTS